MKNGLVIDKEGTRRWYQNGLRHRTDGPAVEYADGDRYWFQNGELHRTDGPSVEWSDGTRRWYLNEIQYSFDEYVDQLYPNDCSKKTLLILKWGR